jgi:hypothetical protein
VYDAGLIDRLEEHTGRRIREALEAVNDGQHAVLNARDCQFMIYAPNSKWVADITYSWTR